MSRFRLYLDSCALSRPLDYPANEEIRLEAEIVERILGEIYLGRWELVSSDVLWKEAEAIRDSDKRFMVEGVLMSANVYVTITVERERRARELVAKGVSYFDALHVACAEDGADFFLTVDKRLLKKLDRIPNLRIKAMNPIDFWRDYAEGEG